MCTIEMISLFASIATLVLFLFYFIGRIITIFAVKKIWKDKVVLGVFNLDEYNIVDEVVDDGRFQTECVFGVLLSKEGIRNLNVYKVVPDENRLNTKKGDLLYSRDFLNIDEAIGFRVDTGDLYPTLLIEYESFDYMKIRLWWADNNKNGVFSEMVYPKHTIKSFMYYLLR